MASIKRLTQAVRRVRDDLTRMRAQVALTPTLLGDAAGSTDPRDAGADTPAGRSADFRREQLSLGQP
ncbi:hypothetical protein acdb102_41580 [Acidothermaceae bacterium B102]|nr:hypothetical protein acdb102_41580 [Acidothermaceae bacterium B102]